MPLINMRLVRPAVLIDLNRVGALDYIKGENGRLPAQWRDGGWAFVEVSRRHGDFALVGVAAVLRLDGEQRCYDIRLAFTGVGPTPVRMPEAESFVGGRKLDEGVLTEILRLVSDRLQPESDIHASADYRRRVGGALACRALQTAASRARGAS